MSLFISYNAVDREYVRRLAAALTLTGAKVWFDEWTIRPGDSIQSAVDKGLSAFETFVLMWSDAASKSRWVQTEMGAALDRFLRGDPCRLVPVRLDGTPIPPLLSSLRYVDASDCNHVRVAREILGITSDAAFRLAVQDFIDSAGLDFEMFWGAGVYVACPNCGATPDNLEAFEATDYQRDDRYVGARCKICSWSAASEI